MRLILILALCMPMLFAGDDKESGGMLNGRAWNEWTNIDKSGYVIGFLDGISELAEIADSPATYAAANNFFAKGTIGESVAELDKLYSDAANLNIPIRYLMHYSERVLKGEYTQAANEQILIALRKRANKLELN